MTKAICVIGNANLDIVLGPLETWPERGTEVFLPQSDFRIGGSAANTALALRQLGAQSGLVASCGSDPAGAMIARAFSAPLDRIMCHVGPTGLSVGVLFPDSERSFLSSAGHLTQTTLQSVLDQLANWPLSGAIALVSGAFALPGLLDGQIALLTHLRRTGATVAIDPGWPDSGWTEQTRARMLSWVALADHILINDKELGALTGREDPHDGLVWLDRHTNPATSVIAKAGAAGCFARHNKVTLHVPTQQCQVFDTVGAGDAFNGGYLQAIAQGQDLAQAIELGNKTAATIISQFPREYAHQ